MIKYPIVFSDSVFQPFFGSWHPYLALRGFGGTTSWSYRYKDQGIVIFGGTPGTSSRHPSVPRHPGWESLLYTFANSNDLTQMT